jgi:hypothetical protein
MYSPSKTRVGSKLRNLRLPRFLWLGLLIALIGFVFQREAEAQVPATPPKPKNVPAASIWVGGLDGGMFVLVTPCPKCGKGLYRAQIHGIVGNIEYKGLLKINQPDGADFDVTKRASFGGWDGTHLMLSDYRYLIRYKPPSNMPASPDQAMLNSLWVAEGDSGIFVHVQRIKPWGKGMYAAHIRSEKGELIYRGKLKIDPVDGPDLEPEFSESYLYWRGDALHLRDGRVLKKMK